MLVVDGSHGYAALYAASTVPKMPLLWRVFVANAVALTVATLVLAISPATVSFPVAATEAVVLLVGLLAMLALNWALLHRALAPLQRLQRFMRAVDPLQPGRRAPLEPADPEVAELTHAFNEMIARLETERRESARRALAAQEAERLRLARDLHDEVGQALTGVMLELDQVVRTADAADGGHAAHARDEVRRTLHRIRQIARRLRPEALDHLGLVSALTALSTDLSRQAGIPITRRIDAELPALPPETEVVVYRVAQEALANVVRHAGATAASIEVSRRPAALVLSVCDNGRGVVQGDTVGTGIRGMRERALMVGGRLGVEARPEGGTLVRLTLPLTDPAG
jgi:two-component system sensor histidine kinase UhpB